MLRQHELELEVEDAQEELDITREERDAVLVSISSRHTAAEKPVDSHAAALTSLSPFVLLLCVGSV